MATQRTSFFQELEGGVFGRLLDFLMWLKANDVDFHLSHSRDNAIMIEFAVSPDSRYEVEFLSDGATAIELFRSSGDVSDDQAGSEADIRQCSTLTRDSSSSSRSRVN